MFEHLFNPIAFGKVTLPNRICFLVHRTNFAQGGRLNDRHVAYYRRRARGGCGLVIVGDLSIHPNDRPWEAMIEAYNPQVVQDYQQLTGAVHEFECAVFAQLNYYGFQSSGAITRHAVWGPSAVADIAFGETAKSMEAEDMAVVTEAFSLAAGLAREGGFDGIEIDMGHESLLRQFLSPLSNLRQDEYGGSVENRMRLALEVIDGVRRSVGEDFSVGIRLCGDEMFWGAITTAESREFARAFEGTGKVDFINVCVGTYYNLYLFMASMHTAAGFTLGTVEQIKRAVDIPVIAGHQIDIPWMAEDILAKKQAHAVGVIRSLICDPDWPEKARRGEVDDIRYCVRDNQGCIGRINQSKTLGCIQNPSVGYEDLGPKVSNQSSPLKTGSSTIINHPRPESGQGGASVLLQQSSIPKRVMVIGAGPAGLEAARAARERGHEVMVYEREDVVGGQVNLAAKGAGREGMAQIIRYLRGALERFGVPVLTGVDVTEDLVLERDPEVVIVATGSRPDTRPVPGEYSPPRVLTVREVIEGRLPVGDKVLFIDESGGHCATATAELLADQGKRVDMITSALFVGVELAPVGDLYLTRQRLLQKGVTFTCDVRVDEIDDSTVRARDIYTNEPVLFEGYHTVVIDMGRRANDRLYHELKGRVRELYRAGDCVAPRGIDMAVFEGRRVGEGL